MAVEVQAPGEERSFTSLVKGIVNDVGDLIKQELRFATTELKTDLRRTGEASRFLVIGIVMAFLGAIVLTLMLVHLLHWLTLPAGVEQAGLPLWACYAIVGFLLGGGGTALAWTGKKKFDSFNPLPDETANNIKENLEWITNSK
jgi:uncharacterized membrane protein YqjE